MPQILLLLVPRPPLNHHLDLVPQILVAELADQTTTAMVIYSAIQTPIQVTVAILSAQIAPIATAVQTPPPPQPNLAPLPQAVPHYLNPAHHYPHLSLAHWV
jgi:hypothetical protein